MAGIAESADAGPDEAQSRAANTSKILGKPVLILYSVATASKTNAPMRRSVAP
jgi:hypothetical protein